MELPIGARVKDALEEYQRRSRSVGVIFEFAALARFGRIVTTKDSLQDGDRIDILRALIVEAKESRRRRAAIQARQKK